MSPVQLFILDSLDRNGEMHGHLLRLHAQREHLQWGTAISGSGLYQAIKRLVADGLIEVLRMERAGNYPHRQIYGITSTGRSALKDMRRSAVMEIERKPDQFDLVVARARGTELAEFRVVFEHRLKALRSSLAVEAALTEHAFTDLTPGEKHALRHAEMRLRADIDWLADLIDALPAEP
jgi:DNA-binding PadR family transcriptional regulator